MFFLRNFSSTLGVSAQGKIPRDEGGAMLLEENRERIDHRIQKERFTLLEQPRIHDFRNMLQETCLITVNGQSLVNNFSVKTVELILTKHA